MNFRKYIRRNQVKQNQDPILTLILNIWTIWKKSKQKIKREKNGKKPKQFIIPQEEESDYYFSTSEDEVIDIEPKDEDNSENSCIDEIIESEKIIMYILLQQMEILQIMDQKVQKNVEPYQNSKIYKREQQKKLKRETTIILLFRLKKKLKTIYPKP